MKILWLCNVMLPVISEYLNISITPTAGWLTGQMNGLQTFYPDNQLCVVCPYVKDNNGSIGTLHFYTFVKDSKNLYLRFESIIKEYEPDIVHIFGTEFEHTGIMIDVLINKNMIKNTIVSIQGLVSFYAEHYYAALPLKEILMPSIRDVFHFYNIVRGRQKYEKRGISEIITLKKVKNVIGRTDWDKACCRTINADLNYYLCNEILRDSFYQGGWNWDNCEKHSIFVTQSSYPIKGFHILLRALSYVKEKYPDVKVYTTGNDLTILNASDKLRLSRYQLYLHKMINKYGLSANIHFLGLLQEKEIYDYLLKSNIFVLPSSIENSPNSMGEAMLVGTPVIASDVGGVSSMLQHNVEGYIYPYDEACLLAYYICSLFSNKEVCQYFSNAARIKGMKTHSKRDNTDKLVEIYNEILQ